MTQKLTVVILSSLVLLSGCVFSGANDVDRVPTAAQRSSSPVLVSSKAAAPLNTSYIALTGNSPAPARTSCPIPAEWVAYQIPINETLYSLATRAQLTADDLRRANCLNKATTPASGAWLYVPPQVARSRPQTLLPLGITALVADPVVAPSGGTVHLTWKAQGPVVNVRLGWAYGSQFVEEMSGLPSIGTWALPVPTDGRETITFVVRAGDGVNEVAAQTTVYVTCAESWFFSPAPPGCPTPPLVTTFREQHFERGTVVYIPVLGAHYVLITGQPAHRALDRFVPGMPLTDPALEAVIPAGLRQPSGPIHYVWRSDENIQTALGWAIDAETTYQGMLQRLADETHYFSASSGAVYRFVEGQSWQVIVPQ